MSFYPVTARSHAPLPCRPSPPPTVHIVFILSVDFSPMAPQPHFSPLSSGPARPLCHSQATSNLACSSSWRTPTTATVLSMLPVISPWPLPNYPIKIARVPYSLDRTHHIYLSLLAAQRGSVDTVSGFVFRVVLKAHYHPVQELHRAAKLLPASFSFSYRTSPYTLSQTN